MSYQMKAAFDVGALQKMLPQAALTEGYVFIPGAGHSGNLSRKEVQDAYCGFVRSF
ncbi:MAG: hypothetical protein HY253_03385 [Burkholderiales bacterium]|nr:hypothetical protein [Burkholderiales bacterium]